MALLIRSFLLVRSGRTTLSSIRYLTTVAKMAENSYTDSARILPEIVKSPLDKRDYRGIELRNKLKVLLISDPLTDKAAASLSVAAGSMSDSKELPGLAHFCEHMLFLGTEKFPKENDYSKYLSDNGGSSNAYTARDHTNYYFDVSPACLSQTLDRFSQFFISPLFTESATEREVNAVHSEHDKNITSDPWRSHQLEIGTSNPDHPYSYFATGNRQTLWTIPQEKSIDVRDALMDYHKKYYSANIMSLAVLGRENLEELQNMVVDYFSEVKNSDVEMPYWKDNPYGPKELQQKFEVVPIKDIRHLNLMFPIPDTTKEYKSSSEGYLSHLIGHEGAGSLLSLLKNNNWVNHLEAGSQVPARGFGSFKIAVDLTTEGIHHTDEILTHIFQYLKMLRDIGPQKWVWEEIRDVNAMLFRFKDKERPQSLVAGLTSVMHVYPIEDTLRVGYIITDYKPELISDILNQMVPEKCRITVTAKEFEGKTKMVEEWYGVNYNKNIIDLGAIEHFKNCSNHPDLILPNPNEFIPSVFDLKPRDEYLGIIPRVILDSPHSHAWFLQDNEFMMPKAIVKLEAFSPLPQLDPIKSNLNHLMSAAIKDTLTEHSYAALVAGLNYNVTDCIYGLEVVVSGYDHKLNLLLNKILDKIINFSCEPARFEVLKEYHLRSLKNWENEQPYSHASYYLTYLLRERRFSYDELINSMKYVTIEKLNEYAKEFRSTLKFEWLLYGNLTANESLEIVSKSQKLFEENNTKALSQVSRMREINLSEGCNYLFASDHKTHKSSCSAVLFQTGLMNTRENVLVELINQIANEPCYNQLRTQEQLGYIVFSGIRRSNGTQGLQFLVQSDRTPNFVESRIDNFLNELEAILNKLTEEEFQQHRTALVLIKSEKPKKLRDRGNIIWSEVISQQFNFDRQNVEIKELETITLKNTIDYFNEYMGSLAKKRKRLNVHIVSKVGESERKEDDIVPPPSQAHELIEKISDWKQQQGLYPVTIKPISQGSAKSKL